MLPPISTHNFDVLHNKKDKTMNKEMKSFLVSSPFGKQHLIFFFLLLYLPLLQKGSKATY